MDEVAKEVAGVLIQLTELDTVQMTVGSRNGEPNKADFYVRLKPSTQRKRALSTIKDDVRKRLTAFSYAKPTVQDFDFTGGAKGRPLMLNLLSDDTENLRLYVSKLVEHLRKDARLKDLDTNDRGGKKEYSFELKPGRAEIYGMNTSLLGQELRAQVQGIPATVFRSSGYEYEVRVMMNEDDRDLRRDFNKISVMNLNNKLVRLPDVADVKETVAQASIDRQNRSRYIQIAADLAAGAGIGAIVNDIEKAMKSGDLKLPAGVNYAFIGESENFAELADSMGIVLVLAITFIYLVLSSLYESFITPLTIIATLPLALCGAFVALLLRHESINLFSGLGMLMLMGVCCKNSILLVDFTNQKRAEGIPLRDAIQMAGKTRLRPILMTSLALIAGTIPVAVGLNEASKQRISMGVAIIGGVISSTVLSLIVVPAILPFFYWVSDKANRLVYLLGNGRRQSEAMSEGEGDAKLKA